MKKLTAMLLALLMLALPFAGMAEDEASLMAQLAAEYEAAMMQADYYRTAIDENGRRATTTITFSGLPASMTGEPAVDQVIADVVNNLSIRYYEEAHEAFFAIGMKQEATGEVADLFNLGVAFEGEEFYLSSNLLGGTYAVNSEEILSLIERVADMLVMVGMIDQETLDEMKAAIPQLMPMVMEYAELMMSLMELQKLNIFELNYDALINAVAPILAKAEIGEVSYQLKNCDAAVSTLRLEITADDAIALVKGMIQWIKDNPAILSYYENYYAYMVNVSAMTYGADMETSTFTEMMDQAVAELEAADTTDEESIKIVLNLDENGLPVSGEIDLPDTDAAVTYTRLTTAAGQAHSVTIGDTQTTATIDVLANGANVMVNFAMAEDGVTLGNLRIDVTDRSAENLTAYDMVMALESYAEEVPVSVKLVFSEDVAFTGVDFTDTAVATVNVNGVDYMTINMQMETAEPGASIKDGDVVRPAQLTEADFANWFVGVINSLYGWASEAIMKLPASVQSLMMSAYTY